MILLGCSARRAAQSQAIQPQERENAWLVGTWTGGGFLVPISHTFEADGRYTVRIPAGFGGESEAHTGAWTVRGDQLTRNGRTVRIIRQGPDFFQIEEDDGARWGYHRQQTFTC